MWTLARCLLLAVTVIGVITWTDDDDAALVIAASAGLVVGRWWVPIGAAVFGAAIIVLALTAPPVPPPEDDHGPWTAIVLIILAVSFLSIGVMVHRIVARLVLRERAKPLFNMAVLRGGEQAERAPEESPPRHPQDSDWPADVRVDELDRISRRAFLQRQR